VVLVTLVVRKKDSLACNGIRQALNFSMTMQNHSGSVELIMLALEFMNPVI
jgi:hypothetical protein